MGCYSSKVGIIQVEEVVNTYGKNKSLDFYTPDKFPDLSIRIPGKEDKIEESISPPPIHSSRISQQRKNHLPPFDSCPHQSDSQQQDQLENPPISFNNPPNPSNTISTNLTSSQMPLPSS